MRTPSDQICVMNWTPCRFPNSETGKDPQQQMSAAFLDACDLWVFHRISVTLMLSGSVAIVSSWCRNRYLSKMSDFTIVSHGLSFNVPVTSDHHQLATICFTRVGRQSVYTSGKVFFKASYGALTKFTSLEVLIFNVSRIHANLLSLLLRGLTGRCYFTATCKLRENLFFCSFFPNLDPVWRD